MKSAGAVLFFMLAVARTAAAAAPDYRAAVVDIGEGRIRASYECELMPTPADIAGFALAAFEAQKKSQALAQDFRLFPKTAAVDPRSLKIAFDVEVPFVLYDAMDGPRSKIIGLGEKIWSGAAAEFEGEPKLVYWEVDVGCGQDLIDALQSVIKDEVRVLTSVLKKR